MNIKKVNSILRGSALSLAFIYNVVCSVAAIPPASGELFNPVTADLTAFKTEHGTTLSLQKASTGSPALEVTFPQSGGFPGIDFPIPEGMWDLSSYNGIEVDLINISQNRLNLALRTDNSGNWRKSPWNTQTIWLAPGAKQTVKLTFGESHGNPGYPLDPANIIAVKLFASKPKAESKILVTGLRAVGSAPASAVTSMKTMTSQASYTESGSSNVAIGENLLKSDTASSFKTEHGASANIVEDDGNSTLKLQFPISGSYPGVDITSNSGIWNLSAYAGVQAKLTNTTSGTLGISMRLENPGNWRDSPWNTETVWIKAGDTKNITVNFGRSFGQPGYVLDSSEISKVKIFINKPKLSGAILVKSLKAVGTSTEQSTSSEIPSETATTSGPVSSESASANFNSPPISGELFDLTEGASIDQLKTYRSSVSIMGSSNNQAIKAVFQKTNYPKVEFPCPKGGWNLEHYKGVEIEVTNQSDHRIQAALRVDNPGDWKTEPWNTEVQKLHPGETKTIKLVFGQQNGAPGFPLNPSKVIGMQLFLIHPKAKTTLVLKNLKAFGSSDQAGDTNAFSSPEDRDTPVTLPNWLGERPPVKGDWVMTLNEEFEGNELDLQTWNTRYVWDGPADSETQRYTKENILVKDGVLSIECEVNPGHQYDDPNLPTRKYATAAMTTYDKWTQRYGYIEARLKPPTARGLWPAFWLMPDRGAESGLDVWQRRSTGSKHGQGMEIDIFEHLTEWGSGRNNIAAHWGGYGANHKQWGSNHVYYGPTSDGWHVFGVLWEPGKLTWYIDGIKKGEWENEEIGNVPAYVILCVQMGSWATNDVDEASLPDYFQIDYIRAWQLAERQKNKASKTTSETS